MEWIPTLQGTYGSNMNAFWWVVCEIYPIWELSCNSVKNFVVNSTNVRTYQQKGENNLPLGINAGVKLIESNTGQNNRVSKYWDKQKLAQNLYPLYHLCGAYRKCPDNVTVHAKPQLIVMQNNLSERPVLFAARPKTEMNALAMLHHSCS